MECIVVPVRQGSEEWEALRRCRITASRIGDVMARPDSKRYRQYRSQIVCELLGAEFENEDEPWFAHGKEMEPRALAAYQYRYNVRIKHDIFLIHHKYEWLGGSPDIITADEREGGEVKCRKLYKAYRAAREDIRKRLAAGKPACPPEHRWQIQTGMWLTGLDSWWYINYYENEKDGRRKLHRVLIERDDKIIAQMEKRCVAFMKECYELAGLA